MALNSSISPAFPSLFPPAGLGSFCAIHATIVADRDRTLGWVPVDARRTGRSDTRAASQPPAPGCWANRATGLRGASVVCRYRSRGDIGHLARSGETVRRTKNVCDRPQKQERNPTEDSPSASRPEGGASGQEWLTLQRMFQSDRVLSFMT